MKLLSHVANEVKKVRVSCGAGNIPEPTLSHLAMGKIGAKPLLLECESFRGAEASLPLLKQGIPTGVQEITLQRPLSPGETGDWRTVYPLVSAFYFRGEGGVSEPRGDRALVGAPAFMRGNSATILLRL